MTKHEALAVELHKQHYSCAQAVLAAFSDVAGVDQAVLLKLAAGFGGGIADMHEICGAVSAMLMAADLIYAEGAPDKQMRAEHDYPRLREMTDAFRRENGSILCRELLGFEGAELKRAPGKTCRTMVADAARILDEYIEAHPVPKAEP